MAKGPKKPWGRKSRPLPQYVMDNLYQVYPFMHRNARRRLGLVMEIPVYIKDPLIAYENPLWGVGEVTLRLEDELGDGPTSSRVAVVDFNADTQTLTRPVAWDADKGWFRLPPGEPPMDGGEPEELEWLPDAPRDVSRVRDPQKYRDDCRQFFEKTVKNPYFHQVNVWAVVQQVLEFYEEPQALGRPVPWGFDGNRLIVIPHAGFGENAFYDRHSKSLQFYYFGDQENPIFTCLSHDIITHETAHAVLDGIRPLYHRISSVQTAAFHEFIADFSAILLSLFDKGVRSIIAKQFQGRLRGAEILANIAAQFGEAVGDQDYLRTALIKETMQHVQGSLSPHTVSQIMTATMFEILVKMQEKILDRDSPGESDEITGDIVVRKDKVEKIVQNTNRSIIEVADRFRRIALQPLDLCPPCDIQFEDYARAVFYNDILSNPDDKLGYREVMLEVFHERKLCTCDYQPNEDLPQDCMFQKVSSAPNLNITVLDPEQFSRSRSAAYHFIDQNREELRIPPDVDVVIVDLHENRKLGEAGYKMPFETVLEYIWHEEVILGEDAENDLEFGEWSGKTVHLLCGGTIIYDERGNLLSWFHKPGSKNFTEADEQHIRERKSAWETNPAKAKQQKIRKPTVLELEGLADLEEGRQRKKKLLEYWSALVRRGLVGKPQSLHPFMEGRKPVMAIEEGEIVSLEIMPHLRKIDFDSQEASWVVNY